MKVSEQIAIMKAYEEGKTIEQKRLDRSEWERSFDRNEWESIVYVEDFPFDFSEYEYRIKSVPKYRHYKSVDEAFNEAKKHGFWMKHKQSGRICFSTRFLEERNTIYINSQAAVCGLDDYVWLDDGSPCGVKFDKKYES